MPEQMNTSTQHLVAVGVDRVIGDAQYQPISSGAVLFTGDAIRLVCATDFEAHLYVVDVGSDGSRVILFRTTVQPGDPIPIPPNGKSVGIDPGEGEDNFYIIASRRGLADGEIYQHLTPAQAERPADAVASDVPSRGNPSSRGEPIKNGERPILLPGEYNELQGQTGQDGIAVVRFWFTHKDQRQ